MDYEIFLLGPTLKPIPPAITFSKAFSKIESSKLGRLFALKLGTRDFWTLSIELSHIFSFEKEKQNFEAWEVNANHRLSKI